MNYRIGALLVCSITIGICGCNDEDTKVAPPSTGIYADYQVMGEEGREGVTIRAQFRSGGPNGPALTLAPPASVALDGEPLQGDSIGKVGTFYEVQKRLDEFGGDHRIDFRDEQGNLASTGFDFLPFTLSPLPPSIGRGDLQFPLSGLEEGAPVHVILTDTSFASNDINSIDTIRAGKLVISEERLHDLRSGPIQLQLISEREEPIRRNGKRVGKLTRSYSLHREFLLASDR